LKILHESFLLKISKKARVTPCFFLFFSFLDPFFFLWDLYDWTVGPDRGKLKMVRPMSVAKFSILNGPREAADRRREIKEEGVT